MRIVINISKTHVRILSALLFIIIVGISADYVSSAGTLVQWHPLSEISADGGASSIATTAGNKINATALGGPLSVSPTGDVNWTGTLIGGAVPWTRLSSVPAGFADGVDNTGITSETDPTVPASVKDGISWTEIGARPSYSCGAANQGLKSIDLNSGAVSCETDDIGGGGITGSGTANYISKWTGGTSLGNSIIYDNGNVGIGTTSPAYKLDVSGVIRSSAQIVSGQGMMAPVYYDYDDSSYYVNPAGISILSQVKIMGGTPGLGKVLTDSDGSGLANWQAISAGVPSGYCIFPAPGVTSCPTGYTSQTIPLLSHGHSSTYWSTDYTCSTSNYACSGAIGGASSGQQFMCCKN